jgi:hypothetical protein
MGWTNFLNPSLCENASAEVGLESHSTGTANPAAAKAAYLNNCLLVIIKTSSKINDDS